MIMGLFVFGFILYNLFYLKFEIHTLFEEVLETSKFLSPAQFLLLAFVF